MTPELLRSILRSRARGLAVFAAAAVIQGGCSTQSFQPRPLDPAATAAGLGSRSLRDEGLRRFLVQNLGHEPANWDFEALSWVAFYYQPSLEVARAQWDAARGALSTASVRPNPTLSLSPGFNSSAASGVSPWFPAVNFDFLLETDKKRDRRTVIEKLNAEAARLNVLASAWQVRSELRQALMELAAANRQQALSRDQSALLQRLEVLLQQRLAAGAAAASDLAPVRAARLRAENAADTAQQKVTAARSRTAQAIGVPVSALEGVVLPEPASAPVLSAADLAAARRQSLQSRTDVLSALARYGASDAALELEVAKQYPDFHVGPGYQWDQGENKWSVALTLELPVFHKNDGPIAEAEAHRREAAAQLVLIQSQVIAAIDGAALQQAAAAARLARLRELATETQRQAGLAEARFAAGGADQVERQNARVELNDVQLALLDAGAEAALAAGQLEDALQVPFAGFEALAAKPAAPTLPPSP